MKKYQDLKSLRHSFNKSERRLCAVRLVRLVRSGEVGEVGEVW